MATFDKLAEELIDQIVVIIMNIHGTKTLSSLSLVSKKFRRITEPHLYHAVNVATRAKMGEGPGNLGKFLRTLQDRRSLLRYVRELTIGPKGVESCLGRWVESLGATGLGPETLWVGPRAYSLAEMLSELLVNAEVLDLAWVAWSGQNLHTILESASLRPPLLRFVDLNLPYQWSLLALRPVFQLPTIESIGIRRPVPNDFNPDNEGGFFGHEKHWVGRTFRVKHLLLDRIHLSDLTNKLLGRACPMLDQVSLYSPWEPGRQMQTATHDFRNKLRRYELRAQNPGYFLYLEEADGPPAQTFTPWRLERKDRWEHFEIVTSGKEGTRALVALLASIQTRDVWWRSVAAFSIDILHYRDYFPGSVSLVVGVEQMDKKWKRRSVIFQKMCSATRGLEFKSHVSTPLDEPIPKPNQEEKKGGREKNG